MEMEELPGGPAESTGIPLTSKQEDCVPKGNCHDRLTTAPTLPAASAAPDSANMFRNCGLLSEIPDELLVPGCLGRGYYHDESSTNAL